MKRLSCKVQRVFEPSRFAKDMVAASYQKLLPIVRRGAATAAGRRAPGLPAAPETGAVKSNSGGVG